MTTAETLPVLEAPARILALMVAANGHIDPRELETLDGLHAFASIGVTRERFVALARECVQEIGTGLAECSWLRERHQSYVDDLLDGVTDPGMRLLLCHLVDSAASADGCVSIDERLVYDHVLARWRISRAMVAEAALNHAPLGS